MMVTFVSQCEKKALNRRVLDAFADRGALGFMFEQTKAVALQGKKA